MTTQLVVEKTKTDSNVVMAETSEKRYKKGSKIPETDMVELFMEYIGSLPKDKAPTQIGLAEFSGISQTTWNNTINKNAKFNSLLEQKNMEVWQKSKELVKRSTLNSEHITKELSKDREVPYDPQKPPDETSENVEEKLENDMILRSTSKEPVINAILEFLNEDIRETSRFQLKHKSLADLKQMYENHLKYT